MTTEFLYYIFVGTLQELDAFKDCWLCNEIEVCHERTNEDIEALADAKGQLILKCPFCVFKSPKKPTELDQRST